MFADEKRQTIENAPEGSRVDEQEPIDPKWAWEPYEPDRRRPWQLPRVGHLFRRAAFGATWGQLQEALEAGPQRTIDNLLQPQLDVAEFNRTYDEYEASSGDSESADGLVAWWLRRVIATPHPLLEKMTLFWHHHFAVTNARVKSARLMRRHIGLLRRHALASFRPLLESVTRDPATLLALGCEANRKSEPNESYARGLMETFVLGVNRVSETDVREAARALTGWFVLRNELRFIPREHDDGVKNVLGQKGNFSDQDVVRILLEQPAAPRLLVRKLYRWLVSECDHPSEPLLEPLASSFGQDYHVGRLVERILRSNLFFSARAYRQRIKSPVDFAAGMVRSLEGLVPTADLARDLAGLGQNLLHPPTIDGWAGGRNWVNEATMLGRYHLAQALLSGAEPYGNRLDPMAVARRHGLGDSDRAGRLLLDLFVQRDLPPNVLEVFTDSTPQPDESAVGDVSRRLRRLAYHMVTLPEYQLS